MNRYEDTSIASRKSSLYFTLGSSSGTIVFNQLSHEKVNFFYFCFSF